MPLLAHDDRTVEKEKQISPFLFTESQNHRVVGVGRDLWGSASPTRLLKQGHPEQVAQDLVQAGFEYHRRRRLHNPSGEPRPVLRHPPPFVMLKFVISRLFSSFVLVFFLIVGNISGTI